MPTAPLLSHRTCLDGHEFLIRSATIRVTHPLPLRRPFQDSSMGPFTATAIATIRLTDEDGEVGEAPAVDLPTLEKLLLPTLLVGGRRRYESLYAALYWRIRNAGFRGPAAGALGAIDLALHDLAARRAGLPLHRFLGATADTVSVYASGGGTNTPLPELVEEFQTYAESGFKVMKMKVGTDFGRLMDEDIRRVRAVHAAVGPGVRLAVDANQIWTAAEATRFARHVADLDLAWFEEPVHSADISALRECCANLGSTVHVAMGESESCPLVFDLLVGAGVRHLQAMYHRLPSVAAFMQVKDLADGCAAAFSSGGFSHLSCQLVAAANRGMTEYLFAVNDTFVPLLHVQPAWKDGTFVLPSTPGSGMQVDWAKVRNEGLLLRQQTWTARDLPSCELQV
jgi:L-alanine-DL-glutamate epimerase-like enolase superfamily enzyme